MISKELLKNILGIKVDVDYIRNEINYNKHVEYDLSCGDSESINIHEVAHMCKEWAFKKGYLILSYPSKSELVFFTDTVDTCYNTNFENGKKYDPMCDIKVCEWILENKDK